MNVPAPETPAPSPEPRPIQVRDRMAEFLAETTPRRLTAVLSFLLLIAVFRHLAILLVFFVVFDTYLGWTSGQLVRRLGLKPPWALLTVTLLLLVLVGLSIWAGAASLVERVNDLRHTLPERIAAWRDLPMVQDLRSHLHDTDKILEHTQSYAADAVGWLAALGHAAVYVTIGFILAVVYRLELHQIESFQQGLPPRTLLATLARWLGHLADAVTVTLQLQLIVAACNALLTLPVLLLLRIDHIAALVLLIFMSSLVPVVGNLLSGAVLTLMAWQSQGWLGVGIFLGLTAILHKIESYYLNPRLTARHVHLPGFILILSLLAWEHLLGFVGLFVSFPVLFVAGRIRAEWRAESMQYQAVTATEAEINAAPPSLST